jgi:hypothetical protein
MRHCKILNFLFEALPLKPWQDFLIQRHMERCPACRARLAGREEARRVLSRAEDFREKMDFWLRVKAMMADPVLTLHPAKWPRTGLAKAAAAAALLVLAAVFSVWFFRGFKVERPAAALPAEAKFEINYIRIGGQPADAYLFQSRDLRMTLIWAEKKAKGGLS